MKDSLSRATDIHARLLREGIGQEGPIEPHESDWNRWVDLAATQRVLPLLNSIVARQSSHVSLEHTQRAEDLEVEAMAIAVRIEHHLIEAAELLISEDIAFAVLKGAATAHLDYRDPSLRQFADVDILVDACDISRCRHLLQTSGWTAPYVLPRGHEGFAHAITLRNARRVEIDLHQRIAHRGLGQLIPTQSLLADRIPYVIAGQRVWALSQHDRLVHASVHAIASRGAYRRLSSIADVLVLASGCADDAEEVLVRADSWRIRRLVGRAVEEAHRAAQLPLPASWAVAIARRPAHQDRLIERAYLSERRRPMHEELAFLRLIPTWADRYLYIRGHFATGPEYARRKDREGIAEQVRYLFSRIRSR